jgi:rfaE bifunctional protein kinase chain/domain
MKTVFIHGNFNILHPGHLRFIRYAAEQGSQLIVGINDIDKVSDVYIPNTERIDALKSVSAVSEVVLISDDLKDVVLSLKPDIIVKGKEYETRKNEETLWLHEYGGKLIFGSGDKRYSSIDLIKKRLAKQQQSVVNVSPNGFLPRHNIQKAGILDLIESFSKLKVAVLGDTIVDRYVECEPVGMSQEDPTIVVNPIHSNYFLGGAGIVAAHAHSLGANVDFYSVIGADESAKIVRNKLQEFGVQPLLLADDSRPTTLKTRYRAQGKTLLRVNDFKRHEIDTGIQNQLVDSFLSLSDSYDLVVFSDFNMGMLCESLVSKLQTIAKQKGILQVADSQSSSLIGKLEKFKGLLLATPTEHEARITMQNDDDGLINVSERLGNLLEANHLFVTLNSEGVLIRTRELDSHDWDTDKLPALNDRPVDTAGAGDAMLISSSLSLISGASVWEAALIGSITSAIQVSRLGNFPISADCVRQGIEEMWSQFA